MFAVLRNREFATLCAIGGLQSICRWLELLAFGVYVFDKTGSPLLVTMVTLVKFAPLAVFGIPFGALTSIYASRSLYLWGVAIMIAVNLCGLLMAMQGSLAIWQVFIISFIGGLFWVLDFPVRRALIGDAVNHGNLGDAMAVDTIANNGTRMLGPLGGGALLQFVGLSGAFLFSLAIYIVCYVLTLRLQIGRVYIANTRKESILEKIRQGLQQLDKQPLLVALLMVTVVYNLFGFPLLSLVPVLGRDALQLSPGMVGLLASMEGAGALLGSLLVLRFGRVLQYRRIYVGGLLVYFAASIAYSLSSWAVSIAVWLILAGVGSAAFAAMQTTLLILNSAAVYRGRLFGLLSLSIGAGVLGFIHVGILANSLGVQWAVFISALLGIVATVAIKMRWPAVLSEQKVSL